MGSFFFAMAGLQTLGEVLLYVGLALALTATVLYARSGLAQLRSPSLKLNLKLCFNSVSGHRAWASSLSQTGASPQEEKARDGRHFPDLGSLTTSS